MVPLCARRTVGGLSFNIISLRPIYAVFAVNTYSRFRFIHNTLSTLAFISKSLKPTRFPKSGPI